MEANVAKFTAVVKRMRADHRRLVNGSHAGVIMGSEGALIRPSHEQHVQMKSQRSLGVITGDPSRTGAHADKSSTAQTPRLRPIERQHSRARHRQRQTAAKLTAFMTAIRRFMKAYAIPWQKLYARFSEHAFGQGNQILVSRVATHLDIRDRVSIEDRSPSPRPRTVQLSAGHPTWCSCHGHESVPTSHVTKPQPLSPRRRINGESSELQTI